MAKRRERFRRSRNRDRLRQPFNCVERWLLKIPTWLFVGLAALGIAGLAILFEEGVDWDTPLKWPAVIFDAAESIAIVSAIILYFKETPDRKEQKHYEGWQVIDNAAAANVETSYARKKALEDLSRDGVSLRGIDVPRSDLEFANLSGADLRRADLEGVKLGDADLRRADLWRANLRFADLGFAKLMDAQFEDADLSAANLRNARFEGADLSGANLRHANLEFANLSGADLRRANLEGANLRHAQFEFADLSGANLRNAKLKLAQLEFAYLRVSPPNKIHLNWWSWTVKFLTGRQIPPKQIGHYRRPDTH
jgi:uncharacterized protein YjbI with pentapeptide repeats